MTLYYKTKSFDPAILFHGNFEQVEICCSKFPLQVECTVITYSELQYSRAINYQSIHPQSLLS